jgi:hypothetical protein
LAALNMCGLVVALVTEMITTLACSPMSNSAGQTRFPTFSMNSSEPGAGSSASMARCQLMHL